MKKTKLLTSLAALALVLGLGACSETEDDSTSVDDGSTPSGTTSLSNYTVAFSFVDEDGVSTLIPEYATAYIIGDWDSWGAFLPLTEADGVYSYTFDSIAVGTHEYKGVMWYSDETVTWDVSPVEIIVAADGKSNATLTVSEEEGDGATQSITKTLSATLEEKYTGPWATNPGELIDLAGDLMNYSVELKFDYYVSGTDVTAESYNRYVELVGILAGDLSERTDEEVASLEDEYATLSATMSEALAAASLTSSYIVDIFVDTDYLLSVTYEYDDEEEDYGFYSLDAYLNDDSGCSEVTYGPVNVGNIYSPTYEWRWNTFTYETSWEEGGKVGLYSLANLEDAFTGAFDYYEVGTLDDDTPYTGWKFTDDAKLAGLDTNLMKVLGVYTYWQGGLYDSYYYDQNYSHNLTYFMEDSQEMLSYYSAIGATVNRAAAYPAEDDIYVGLFDVGATDASESVASAFAAYAASLEE